MNQNILNSLDYFSVLTQRTLSAFHLSGTNDSLSDDMDEIKRFITKSKVRKLITVIQEGDKYKRFFEDGYVDYVDLENIITPSYFEIKEEHKMIENALMAEVTPIVSLKLDNDIICVDNKSIEKPSEKIFFMNLYKSLDA